MMKPASPLPFEVVQPSSHLYLRDANHVSIAGQFIGSITERADLAYLAHAANACPKLVEALKEAIALTPPDSAFLESRVALPPEECREALYKIEHCELAMGALRTLLDYPTNAEAKAHAEKVLASIAWRPTKKAAPQAPAQAGETPVLTSSSSKTVAPVGAAAVLEDASDLV